MMHHRQLFRLRSTALGIRPWACLATSGCGFLCAAVVSIAALAGTTDVTPDIGVVASSVSEPFHFLGARSLLVTEGRSGAHRTDDRGSNWRRAMQGMVDPTSGMEPFVVGFCSAPSVPSTVYAVTNRGNNPLFSDRIYSSGDLGKSFHPQASIDGARINDCAVDPVNSSVVYVLGSDNTTGTTRLFKSTDGAATFAAVGAGLENNDAGISVRVSPTAPATVFVSDQGTNQGLYVSMDGGLSFVADPAAPDFPGPVFAHPARQGVLFVAGVGGMYRSLDGGNTFTPSAGLTDNARFVAFDPRHPDTNYVAAGIDGLFRSADDGATYQRLAGPSFDQYGQYGVTNVGVQGGGRNGAIYIGTGHGPFRSDDGGNTFAAIHNGYHGIGVNDLGIDGSGRLLVPGWQGIPLFRGASPGQPQPYVPIGDNAAPPGTGDRAPAAVAASPSDPNTILLLIISSQGASGVYRTDDGGATWSGPVTVPVGAFSRMTFAPSDASRVYVVADCCGAFHSEDGGRTFTQTSPTRPLTSVAVDPTNADVVYAGTRAGAAHGILKSIDGGITFVDLPGTVGSNFGQIAIDPSAPQTVYAARRQGGVFKSTDGGATWALAGSLPGGETLGVVVDTYNTAHVFAWIQAQGVYRSNDGGATWAAADTGESLRRSGIEFGHAAMVADPAVAGRVYIGDSGVVQVDTGP